MIEVPRDRYDRPLIVPLDAEGRPDLDAQLVPYQRVSKLAKTLDDTGNLMNWKQRVTAIGLAVRPDLMLRVKSVLSMYPDPLNNTEATQRLRRIIKEADEAGGGSAAASTGTAYHELTEALDAGKDMPTYLGEDVERRLDQYREATADLKVVATEVFVVNDEIRAAGTFDRLFQMPDGSTRVGDLKTGRHDPRYPHGVAAQVACYANSMIYNPETGERTPIHPELDRDWGVLVHLPAKDDGCRIYTLNLRRGWRIIETSGIVREIRAWKAPEMCVPSISLPQK